MFLENDKQIFDNIKKDYLWDRYIIDDIGYMKKRELLVAQDPILKFYLV